MFAKKVTAKEILAQNKDNTNYFNGVMSMADMKSMLRYRMGFGEGETNTIIAALVLSGAKFTI